MKPRARARSRKERHCRFVYFDVRAHIVMCLLSHIHTLSYNISEHSRLTKKPLNFTRRLRLRRENVFVLGAIIAPGARARPKGTRRVRV